MAINATNKNNSIISTSNYIHASSTCLCFDFITNLFEPKFYIKVKEKEELSTKSAASRESLFPCPEDIKLFSCSTQLSSKFRILIQIKIPTNEEASCFKTLALWLSSVMLSLFNWYTRSGVVLDCIDSYCWHFNIYEQDKVRAKLNTLGAWFCF